MEEILNIIKKMKKYQTFGGNCGTFALALERYIKEKYNKNLCFILTVSLDGDEQGNFPNENINDLIYGDYDLYHVMLGYIDKDHPFGLYFDGDGIYDGTNVTDYMITFCYEEYGNPNPTFVYLEYPEQSYETIKNIILNNTNWSISVEEFYKKISNI